MKACARCGRVRGYRPGDKGNRSDLCADCRWVDPDFGKKSY